MLLRLEHLSKRFSGVAALDDVSFDLAAGEVHALVGENGAGKSTLINILSGVLQPDEGQIYLGDAPVVLRDPPAARRLGISVVHQEVEVFPALSLAENLALAVGLPTRLPGIVDWRAVFSAARRAAGVMREPPDVAASAGDLPIAQRQMARIAVAVEQQAKVLLLDEPTSSLSESESQWLFEHVAALKRRGVGVIYISHRQNEIFELADRITVLRDGRRVWSGPTGGIDVPRLVEAMVGRQYQLREAVERASAENSPPGQPLLEVSHLTDAAGAFREVSLRVDAGEIVALYGLVGAGRSEFAQALMGLRGRPTGAACVGGAPLALGSAASASRAGLAYLPEDRLQAGIFRQLPIRVNASIASLPSYERSGLIAVGCERAAVAEQIAALGVKCQDQEQPIRELSGGNQQKVVLARWLLNAPRVLLLDEPTRGVDVAAKADLHERIRDYARRGNAVMMISSDLAEAIDHADRIVVFRQGRVAGELSPRECSARQIAHAALPIENLAATTRKPAPAWMRRALRSEWGVLLATVGLGAALAATNPHFLTVSNLLGLLTNTAVWSILALAASCVIVAGGIDISIGAIFALAAASAALVMKSSLPAAASIPLGVAAALVVGAAAGAANALIAIVGRVHPIVVTLGTMTAIRGLLIMLTGGDAITNLPAAFDAFANGRLLGVNGAIVVMIAVVAAMQFWAAQTVSGRQAYALGTNPAAARTVGISQTRVWLTVFALGGTLSAVAALVELSQNGSMQSSMGVDYELNAIAAAVIGGTAITGGRGRPWGVLLGALLIGVVNNSLVLWQVSRYHNRLVIGLLILAAVLWDLAWQKLTARTGARG